MGAWVEFIAGSLCSEGFFFRFFRFPSPQKINNPNLTRIDDQHEDNLPRRMKLPLLLLYFKGLQYPRDFVQA